MNGQVLLYMHDVANFVAVQLLEDTPAVLSFGKLCKEHDYTCKWSSGQWATSEQKWESDLLQNRELRPIGSSRTVIKFHHIFIFDIASAGPICFFWIQQIFEVTKGLREVVPKMLREIPNGWRSPQRISRSQKPLRPRKFLMTQIRFVLF